MIWFDRLKDEIMIIYDNHLRDFSIMNFYEQGKDVIIELFNYINKKLIK